MKTKIEYYFVTGIISAFQWVCMIGSIYQFVNYDNNFEVLTAFILLIFAIVCYALGMSYKRSYTEGINHDLYNNMNRSQRRKFDRTGGKQGKKYDREVNSVKDN